MTAIATYNRFPNLRILDHPLAQQFVATLRDKDTATSEFRVTCRRLTLLLAMEASRDLCTQEKTVQTPLEATSAAILTEPLAAVVILRAGLGMLDPIVDLLPDIAVGYVGMERDENTAVASSYYSKLPDLPGRTVFLLDPMLATGGSAAKSCDLVKSYSPRRIIMLTVVAAPEGVDQLLQKHPDVTIYTSALDRCLNERRYIVPGLGDFGDRLYGT